MPIDWLPTTIRLPRRLQQKLETAFGELLHPVGQPKLDFARPAGESALAGPDSVSWRVFKNPVVLFVGGVAAVLLELAEPEVRAGVWQHSTFRSDPLSRLRRTGLAAMITVYGARSVAEPMIARVVGLHAKVRGITASRLAYSATDPRLLTWVHATAAFGFAEAYSRYVEALSDAQFDGFYREGEAAARLYGAADVPTSNHGMQALFASMRSELEPSPITFDFLRIMRETPALPAPFSWLQSILVKAAVDTVPHWARERLGLTDRYGLRPHERRLVQWAAALAERVVVRDSPPVQSCVRLGLPFDYLYR